MGKEIGNQIYCLTISSKMILSHQNVWNCLLCKLIDDKSWKDEQSFQQQNNENDCQESNALHNQILQPISYQGANCTFCRQMFLSIQFLVDIGSCQTSKVLELTVSFRISFPCLLSKHSKNKPKKPKQIEFINLATSTILTISIVP